MSARDQAGSEWGVIDGRTITLPVVVPELNQAALTYSVDAAAAERLLPGDGFQILESAPGRALFVLAAVDYRRNPWGDYDEVNLGFMVHPAGRTDVAGSFIYRMPVNQEFTMKAGRQVMGFPKTVEDIAFRYANERIEVRLEMDGAHVLTLAMPRAPAAGDPPEITTSSYSYLDGVPTETPLTLQMATGSVDPSAIELELGDSPVANELRSLGLPCPPELAMWGEGLSGTFQRPVPLRG